MREDGGEASRWYWQAYVLVLVIIDVGSNGTSQRNLDRDRLGIRGGFENGLAWDSGQPPPVESAGEMDNSRSDA